MSEPGGKTSRPAIVGQDRPDFRTISDFRTLPLDAFKDVLVPVLRLAGEAGRGYHYPRTTPVAAGVS